MLPEVSIGQLIAKLEKELQALSEKLTGGGATDFPHYKHLAGQIKGLTIAKNTAIELAKRQDENDDFDV